MANGNPDCDPVWQYLLVMSDRLAAVGAGIKSIGGFHTAEELEPLAQAASKALYQLNKELDKLTEWVYEHPEV